SSTLAESLRHLGLHSFPTRRSSDLPASDVLRDRQVVSERLAAGAGLLPRQAQAPSLTPLTSSTSTVLVAGLTSSSASLMDLRTRDRKSTRLNSSHVAISYAVVCLKK